PHCLGVLTYPLDSQTDTGFSNSPTLDEAYFAAPLAHFFDAPLPDNADRTNGNPEAGSDIPIGPGGFLKKEHLNQSITPGRKLTNHFPDDLVFLGLLHFLQCAGLDLSFGDRLLLRII